MKKQEGVEGVEEQLRDGLVQRVLGAAMTVHTALGPGLLESCYGKSLALELAARDIPFQTEHPLSVRYRGEIVGEARVDFLVEGRLVVELKAVESLMPIHTAQLISYLRAANLPVGLLINFNVAHLRQGIKRVSHPLHYRSSSTAPQLPQLPPVLGKLSLCPPTI